jgi:ribosome recycling factor
MSQAQLQKAKQSFDGAIAHLKAEFTQLQTGRASASIVDGLLIDSYGMKQPLKAVASVSVPDAKTIMIQPWDKGVLGEIEKAIRNSDLNLNPVNNGAGVIINIPDLTEERRRDLTKVVGRMTEEAKISIRNARHDAMAALKRMEHDGDLSEDEKKRGEKQLQEQVDAANKEVVDLSKDKEAQIMKV